MILNCKQVIELASQGQDSKLRLSTKIRFRLHLLMCKTCSQYVEQLAFIKKSVSKLDEHIQNTDHLKLSTDAKARIRDVISKR